MLTLFKQSLLAFFAYNISSVVTIFQMAAARVAFPRTYDWFMDKAEVPALMAKDLASTAWTVVTEFSQLP